MKTLKESLLDNEEDLILDDTVEHALVMSRNYLKNPKIKLYPNYLMDFLLFDRHGRIRQKDNFDIEFFKDMGDYPGWQETAKMILEIYFKYQKHTTDDSIFGNVTGVEDENFRRPKTISPKYTNKIFKNNKSAIKNYIDNLEQPEIITNNITNMSEFVLLDQGDDWAYVFGWIPKLASDTEKEILYLLFEACIRAIK